MSRYIKTRNSNQCRSHHQKMAKRYGSLSEIIAAVEKEEATEREEQERQELSNSRETLDVIESEAKDKERTETETEASPSLQLREIEECNAGENLWERLLTEGW